MVGVKQNRTPPPDAGDNDANNEESMSEDQSLHDAEFGSENETETGDGSEMEDGDDASLSATQAGSSEDEDNDQALQGADDDSGEGEAGEYDDDGRGANLRPGASRGQSGKSGQSGMTLRAGFEDLQIKVRKISAGRCVIGVDIELALDEDAARAEAPRRRSGADVREPGDMRDPEDMLESADDSGDDFERGDAESGLELGESDSDSDAMGETDETGLEAGAGEAEQDLELGEAEHDEADHGDAEAAFDDGAGEDEAGEHEAPRARQPQVALRAARAQPVMAKRPLPPNAAHRPKINLWDVQPHQHNNSVLLVQKALAKAVGLDYSSGPGVFGPRTQAAYKRWQHKCGYSPAAVNGKPGPASLRKLGEKYGFLVNTNRPAPTKKHFDRSKFFQGYTQAFGGLNHSQRAGLDALLTAAEADPNITDVRWLAYMLATVKRECGDTWRPIPEYGRGKGRPYGKPVTVTDPQGRKHTNVYYGRGFVQLTGVGNYKSMGQIFKNRLLYNPDLALQPALAYKIMSLGMRQGTFTSKKLSDYIHGAKTDYLHARQIINGMDRAELIAGYAVKLERILRRSAVARPPVHRAVANGVPAPRAPGGHAMATS